jgi:Domain of unknown function (DUF4352)
MKTFLAVIGFLGVSFVVICILVGALASSRHSSNLTDTSSFSQSSADSSTSQSDPGFERVAIGNAYFPKTTVSHVAVTLTKAQALPSFFNAYEIVRPESGQFVAVGVLITNEQRDEITMSTSLFKLLSPEGLEYSASEKSLEIGGTDTLFLKGINPGLTKSGVVLFEVPNNVDISSLRLSFRGGMTGEEASLPLSEVGIQISASPPPTTPELAPATTETVSTEPEAKQTSEPPTAAPIVSEPPPIAAPIVREPPPTATAPQMM